MSRKIPDKLEEIPREYLKPAAKQGMVEEFSYDTRDAFGYRHSSKDKRKKALVYLPYGYDETERYDILYLMHGGGGNERTYLGNHAPFPREQFKSYGFKNVIDHAMEDGKIRPLIIVCLTYNNDSERDSFDYSLAIRLTSLYPQELMNDLVPAVESRYSTYAKDVTAEEIKASRDHRGFGGFSMGSVATWHISGISSQ